LAHEDKSSFLNVAQRSGQKPAPFIPILDNNFEVRLMKVPPFRIVFKHSLTHFIYCRIFSGRRGNIEAVFDQDPQRVAVLRGPVAVRHSIKKDEAIKEMLDNVVSGLTTKVLKHSYGGDESKIRAIDYLGVKPAPVPSLPGAHVLRTGNEVKLTPLSSLPTAEHWLQVPRWT